MYALVITCIGIGTLHIVVMYTYNTAADERIES